MHVKLLATISVAALSLGTLAQAPPQTRDAKQIHKEASAAVIKDLGVLDQTVPDDLRGRFEKAVGKTNKKVTYRYVLIRSEQILQRDIMTVFVAVDAAPQNCPVTYRPIAGGGSVDFGTTRATKRLAPATYEFTCQCTEKNAPKKVLECTEDTNVDFECRR